MIQFNDSTTKQLSLVLFFLLGLQLYAQDSKFAIEANYPLPIDDNFLGRSFNGIVDLGVNYRCIAAPLINIGIALNGGLYRNTKDERVQPFDVTILFIQPRIFSEFNIASTPNFHPSVGLGYSILSIEATNINPFVVGNTGSNLSENQNGFHFNLGAAYDINDKVFAQIQYQFTKINIDNPVPDIAFNANINILKLGLGYRF
jgi:opacity protein-like surface antigen